MTDLESFITLSRYAGERFDLVQAGGGNTSVKMPDGTMLIKASGAYLSDIEPGKGYTRIDVRNVLSVLNETTVRTIADKRERNAEASRRLQACVLDGGPRPSIETFLHALLNRYTLHSHPIVVNAVACRTGWKDELARAAGGSAAFVRYRTPGMELASELKSVLDEFVRRQGRQPEIVFLQNHGLIVSTGEAESVMARTDQVLMVLERMLGADMGDYRMTNRISSLINEPSAPSMVSYLSRDAELMQFAGSQRQLFFTPPFCPDGLVYCGMGAAEIRNLDDREAVARYREKFGEPPRVVLYGDRVFFTGRNVRKAREAEEVFKFHIMTLAMAGGDARSLSIDELAYLGNWEAEQFRKTR